MLHIFYVRRRDETHLGILHTLKEVNQRGSAQIFANASAPTLIRHRKGARDEKETIGRMRKRPIHNKNVTKSQHVRALLSLKEMRARFWHDLWHCLCVKRQSSFVNRQCSAAQYAVENRETTE